MRTYGRKSKPAATLRAIGESLENRQLLTVLVPSDLQTGDKYHLAFVSSQPIAGDFGTQVFPNNGLVAGDAFVSALAAAPGTVTMNGTYQAIISDSVQGVHALTRVSTSFPIYNTNGDRVANDYAGLFGGPSTALSNPIVFDQYGDVASVEVWTGTNSSGFLSASGDNDGWLNTGSSAMSGTSNQVGDRWIENTITDGNVGNLHLYGISEVYEVCDDGTGHVMGNCMPGTGGPGDPGTVSGRKWHDLDGDGLFDMGETGLNGWTIELVDSSGNVYASNVTHDVSTQPGHYSFSNVPPGSYTVREVLQTGWQQCAPLQPHQVTIVDGDSFTGLNFGNCQTGSIHGKKFNDINANGVLDEELIIIRGGRADGFVTTDGPELTDPRTDFPTEVANPNPQTHYDSTDSNRVFYETLTFAKPALPIESAFLRVHARPVSWARNDSIHIVADDWNVAAPTFRDAFGYEALSGPTSWQSPNFSQGETFDIQIVNAFDDMVRNGRLDIYSQDETAIDFVELHITTKEECLPNWPITVTGTDGMGNPVSVSTTTMEDDPNTPEDETGMYWVDGLKPGSYTVAEGAVSGWKQTAPATGTHSVDLESGEVVEDQDFGNYEPASIHGTKWNDLNGDGVWDSFEPAMSGWTVFIDENGNGQHDPLEPSTVTDADGEYWFMNLLPGTYVIGESMSTAQQQAGWQQTYPSTGRLYAAEARSANSPNTSRLHVLDPDTGAILASGDTNADDDLVGIDFHPNGTLYGHGLELDGGGVSTAQQQNDYSLNIAPTGFGNATHIRDTTNVVEGGLAIDPATDIATQIYRDPSGLALLTYNMANPVVTHVHTLLNYNGNPLPSTTEIDGLTYRNGELYGIITGGSTVGLDDHLVRISLPFSPSPHTVTDIGPLGVDIGDWSYFGGLAYDPNKDVFYVAGSGSQDLYEVDPNSGAAQLVGNTGIHEISGLTFGDGPQLHAVTVEPGDVITEVDFGNFLPGSIHGQKWHDLNGDGIRQADEPGLNDWTIEVYDANGDLVASQVTHSMEDGMSPGIDPVTEKGWYWIEGLPAGDYTIREVPQNGWVQTSRSPVTVEGRAQIDNYAQLYSGSEFGGSLAAIGPLLYGPQPCCTAFNILDGTKVPSSAPITTSDAYLYFTAWNEFEGTNQGLIADLTIAGNQVLSGAGWEVLPTGVATSGSTGPSLADIQSEIANAASTSWQPVNVGPTNQNGLLGYPTLNGIDSGAEWIWYDSSASPTTQSTFGGTDHGEYLIFRVPAGAKDHTVTVTPGSVQDGFDFGNATTGIHGQKFDLVDKETSLLRGDRDGFMYTSPEPTTPSPNLADYLAVRPTREYDEPGNNKTWGESFSNLPSDITRLSINVHLTPDTSSLSVNDTISFGVMDSGGTQWKQDVQGNSYAAAFRLGYDQTGSTGYGPNQAASKVWNQTNFPTGQLQKYTFDATSPVVKGVNNGDPLDVIVQDDTVVDYIEICVEHQVRVGLNGWTITADDGTTTLTQTTHDMDLDENGIIDPATERGLYWFEEIPEGTYSVTETQKRWWRARNPVSGSHAVTVTGGQTIQGIDFENDPYVYTPTCYRDSVGANTLRALAPQYELTFDELSGPLASDQFLASHGVTLSGLGAGPAAGVFAAYADTQPAPAISNLLGYDGTYQPAGDEVLYVPQGAEQFMIEFDEPINSLSAFVATVDTAASDDGFWIRVYSASGDMEETFIFEPDEGDGNPAVSQLAYHFRDDPVSKVAIWNATGDIILDELVWSTAAAQQAELLSQAQDHTDFFDDLPGTTIQFDFADPNVELVPREGYTGEYVLEAKDIPGVDIIVRKNPGGKVALGPEGGELGELDGYDGTLASDGSNVLGIDLGGGGGDNIFEPIVVLPPVEDTPNTDNHDAWITLEFAQGVTAVGGFAAIPGSFSLNNGNGSLDWPFIVAVFGPDGGELDVEPFFGGQAYSDPDNSEFHWHIAAPEGEEIGSVRFYSIDSNGAPDFDAQLLLGNLTIQDTGVVGRHIFYNESGFDDNDAAATAADDGAIASDKFALEPGEIANFAHYTSYSKGINGIMVDLARAGDAEITAADFEFKVGNSDSPSDWITAPSPEDIVVRPGEGVGESDRVTIIWANNEIEKQWLEVTILANDNTELDSPDVHYWGNAIGETGNDAASAFVNTSDVLDARANPHNIFNRAEIDDRYDFNRDSFVNTADVLVSRENGSNIFNRLKLIDLSMPSSAAARSSAVDTVFAKPTAEDPSFDFDDFLALATNFGTGELGDLANDETVSFNEFLLIAAALKKSI